LNSEREETRRLEEVHDKGTVLGIREVRGEKHPVRNKSKDTPKVPEFWGKAGWGYFDILLGATPKEVGYSDSIIHDRRYRREGEGGFSAKL